MICFQIITNAVGCGVFPEGMTMPSEKLSHVFRELESNREMAPEAVG
jgi:hypothetical protein